MIHLLSSLIIGVTAWCFALVFTLDDYVSSKKPFGWVGVVFLAIMSGFFLWRAGSVKAWKETAEGRLQRIDDLIAENRDFREELTSLKAELRIPERIEGIIQLMGEQSIRQDAASDVRVEVAIERIAREFESIIVEHDNKANTRTDKILDALKEGRAT